MSVQNFEAFKAETSALRDIVLSYTKKTIRDESLLDRIRTLFRTWTSIVEPSIATFLQNKSDFLKLTAELQALAKLTSKFKPVNEYRRRLNKSIQLLNSLVLYLPPANQHIEKIRHDATGDLFIPGIPDLPLLFVPNALIGWKGNMEAFISKYPFERSIFIMIRYRRRNKRLIESIKTTLSKNGFNGILASEHKLTDDLYNPIACLLCCSRGLVVFDRPETNEVFNPNVAYELGTLHLLGRECCILKHERLKVLQTDILMKLYLPYARVQDVVKHITDWICNGN